MAACLPALDELLFKLIFPTSRQLVDWQVESAWVIELSSAYAGEDGITYHAIPATRLTTLHDAK